MTGLLVLRENTALDVVLVPGVLEAEGAGQPIPRDAVTIDPASFTLTPGIPFVVRVSVIAPNPGTFNGQIQATVRPVDDPSPPAVPVPFQDPSPSTPPDEFIGLTVIATNAAVPSLVGEETLTTRRLDDGPRLIHPFLSWLFVDPSEREPEIEIPLTNASAADVTVQGGAAAMTDVSGRSGDSGVASVVPLASPLVITPGSIASVGVPYNDERADPGHYIGVVNLIVDETSAPTPVSIDLTVRQGPTAPFLLMLAGLFLGALFKWASTRGDAIANAAARQVQLSHEIDISSAWPRGLTIIRSQLASVSEYLVARPDVALTEITNIAVRLDLLNRLYSWWRDHQSANVERVVELLRLQRTDDAEKAFKDLQDAAIEAEEAAMTPEPTAAPAGEPAPAAVPRGRSLFVPVAVGGLVFVIAAVVVAGLVPGVSARPGMDSIGLIGGLWPAALAVVLLIMFLWSGRITVILERNLGTALAARSILRFVLSIGLVLVGMRVLYTEDVASTLGGQFNPIFQYLLWGLGADVSAQALSKARG